MKLFLIHLGTKYEPFLILTRLETLLYENQTVFTILSIIGWVPIFFIIQFVPLVSLNLKFGEKLTVGISQNLD
jgi:hypothetical protein